MSAAVRPRDVLRLAGVALLLSTLCASVLGACGGDRTDAAGEGTPAGGGTKATKSTYVPPSPLPPPTQSASAPPVLGAHVARVEGGAHIVGGEVLTAGRSLLPGVWVETGADGMVVLDYRREGRVEIDADSTFAIGADRPMEIIVQRGGARLTLPPAGNSSRPSLRAATPDFAAEIPGSGHAYVSVVAASPGTRVSALSGTTETTDGTLAEDGTFVRTFVPPGQATEDGHALVEGALTVNAARAQHLTRSRARVPRAAERPSADAGLARLDAALAAVEAEAARGAALDDAHRAAVANKAPNAREALLAIAHHSQANLRLTESLLVAWERAQAAAGPAGREAIAQRATRVRAALPGAPVP